ncbi:MAG: PEP/pyruvate-binding domain-containing protein [Pseudomonadota bacterium]
MEVRDLIRQISDREPLNPYQIAGMAAVMTQAGVPLGPDAVLEVREFETVTAILDRTGAEAAHILVELKHSGPCLILLPRFSRAVLDEVALITPFRGRRDALREDLIPILSDIPNWLDVVAMIVRYGCDRGNDPPADKATLIMDVLFSYLFAACLQPFDRDAGTEGEHAVFTLIESILKADDQSTMALGMPMAEKALDFLTHRLFATSVNSFERRVGDITGIRAVVKKRSDGAADALAPRIDLLACQAVVNALDQLRPSNPDLLPELEARIGSMAADDRERFRGTVIAGIRQHSAQAIEDQKMIYQMATTSSGTVPDEAVISEGIAFVRDFGEAWRITLTSYVDMIDRLPPEVHEAFAGIIADQTLELRKPEVIRPLIDGLCRIVEEMERIRRRASRDLIHFLVDLFMDRAYATDDPAEAECAILAVESLGTTLGRNNYFLMAQEFVNRLVVRPLIAPRRTAYSVEDDDTGEPLVLAEESGTHRAHVRHIKMLCAVIASNPRIMYRLIPYLTVQLEIGGARLFDEDLIQYSISSLLRANSSVTHFLLRTLIKAIPYSLKEIGPLDTLRLTAAGLAKELANRGVKPIGNFLGKLRGDIHWRGSIENFYFCLGILRYFSTGNQEEIAEWMPAESLPHLKMESWCSAEEAQGIRILTGAVFGDLGIGLTDKADILGLVNIDTGRYRNYPGVPELSRRMVLDVIDLLKGLHTKYFIIQESAEGSTVTEDLEKLNRIIGERRRIKDQFLIPDVQDPLPRSITLTDGSEDYVLEMERIAQECPGTPVVLREKKAGHAYAQKAKYIEERFEMFNRDLKLEALQETLATSANNIHFDRITHESLPKALTFVHYLVRGLSVNGHSSYYLEQAGRDLLRADILGLTFDKVRDILHIIKNELDDIHTFYRNRFEAPFDDYLSFCSVHGLPKKLRDLTTLKEIPETDFFKNYLKTLYVTDLQARDGNLRVIETFVEKVELFLNLRLAESGRRVAKRGEAVTRSVPFYFPDRKPISPCRIGLKASLLRYAETTPAYFVITTGQHLKSHEEFLADAEFRQGLHEAVARLEAAWGRNFGDPANPALFSVRSGARISMPGMMITVTNVGINDEIAAALARKVDPWFAYDCYRRFLQEFTQAVFGVGREEFQQIMDETKDRLKITQKAQLSARQMTELAFRYKERAVELAPRMGELLDGGKFLDILILGAAVVLHSFETRAACKYRDAAGIHGIWRTPAIVQCMVYGNMERRTSGTGVMSYNPFTMDLRGDFAEGDQGTDVVDGKVATIPVYDLWESTETLASKMPETWKQLSTMLFRTAERLHLDTRIEYTIEKGKVYILQIRKDRDRKEHVSPLRESGYRVMATGTGVSGKVFRGIMVTDRNQIAPFRHINKAQSILDSMNERLPDGGKLDGFIFVVNDPIPEEIMEEVFSLPVTTAVVSRLGGRGAHVADISKALGKVYVGQVQSIAKFTGKPESVRFGDLDVVVGTKLIIHGQTGEVALC